MNKVNASKVSQKGVNAMTAAATKGMMKLQAPNPTKQNVLKGKKSK